MQKSLGFMFSGSPIFSDGLLVKPRRPSSQTSPLKNPAAFYRRQRAVLGWKPHETCLSLSANRLAALRTMRRHPMLYTLILGSNAAPKPAGAACLLELIMWWIRILD